MGAAKRILMLTAVLAMLLTVLVPMASADAETTLVDVVDSQGKSVEGSTALIDRIVYETYTVNGQTTFFLEKGTEISVPDRYLRIGSDSGTFSVSVSCSAIGGSLKESGLVIRLTSGDDLFEADLNKSNDFSSMFRSGDSAATLKGGQLYRISIMNAEDIPSKAAVEQTGAFSIYFSAQMLTGYVVEFYNGDNLVHSTVVSPGGTIPELPALEDYGDYTFIGWYDSSERQFTPWTEVNSDLTLHAKWYKTPQPRPPSGDVTERTTEVIENDDGSVTVKETEKTTHKDGSVTVKETDTTVREDGSSQEITTVTQEATDGTTTIKVDEVDKDADGNETTTDCTLLKKTNDDGTEYSE